MLADGIKEQLRSNALLALQLRSSGVDQVRVPLHGLIVLVGPPGTGKTTLARGLASEVEAVVNRPVAAFELDSHQMTSEFLGRSQRTVVEVLHEELPSAVGDRLAVLIVDEVEALAIGRSVASLETNPADVHRATDAVLAGLDLLARELPNLLIVATTNFPEGVDAALLSRADLQLSVPLPGRDAIASILADTLDELARFHPALKQLANVEAVAEVARVLVGLDGRSVRKFVIATLAADRETTIDPGKLTIAHLVDHATRRNSGRLAHIEEVREGAA